MRHNANALYQKHAYFHDAAFLIRHAEIFEWTKN